ncbi:hypothetical protein VNO78_17309 [Psophocarpus tetragonolobus]|uniref:Uncharacterized protein n=1 Tax=Psophocarpus tetragonolobus TaxID=3891 RepID=A0AAN9SIX0_PSOTE
MFWRSWRRKHQHRRIMTTRTFHHILMPMPMDMLLVTLILHPQIAKHVLVLLKCSCLADARHPGLGLVQGSMIVQSDKSNTHLTIRKAKLELWCSTFHHKAHTCLFGDFKVTTVETTS